VRERQGARLFHGIEVLALDILDQGHGNGGPIRDVTHHRRDLLQAGELGGAPAAFAGDDFVFVVADGAHDDGLHHALGANRVGQLVEGFRMHIQARLITPALNQVNGQFPQRAFRGTCLARGGSRGRGGAKQRIQPPAQSSFFRSHQRRTCSRRGSRRSAPNAKPLHGKKVIIHAMQASPVARAQAGNKPHTPDFTNRREVRPPRWSLPCPACVRLAQ